MDGKLVLAVKGVGTQHRLSCAPFHLRRRESAELTRERWQTALDEIHLAPAGLHRVDGLCSVGS
jgi:hypothetical protein